MFLTITVEIREKLANSPTGEASYVTSAHTVDQLANVPYSTQVAYLVSEAVDQHRHLEELRDG